MELCCAVVQLRRSALSDRKQFDTGDYDVLVMTTGSSNLVLNHHSHAAADRFLPKTRLDPHADPVESALATVRRISRRLCRRAVRIPLFDSEPSSSSHQVVFSGRSYSTLYCVPVLEKDKSGSNSIKNGRFENLSRLLNLCLNSSELVDAETRHMVIRLEEWLREQHMRNPLFIARLFVRPLAAQRIRICAHNPAFYEEARLCHTLISAVSSGASTEENRRSCELADEVRKGNDARAKMISLEKYDVFVMNPIYGAGLHYKAKDEVATYFAKGRASTRRCSLSSRNSTSARWPERYPLHKAAYAGDHEAIRRLLSEGADPNECDADSWTPLHYCAWYNQLQAMQVLLNYGNETNVNIVNKTGSTALHFCARSASVYMVELLLTHPAIDTQVRDADGKRPIDLCACVPRPEWQETAELLRSWKGIPKIRVDLMDSSNAMLEANQDTTALQLRMQMCRVLKLNEAQVHLFALWICSDRLSLQLKDDHKPLVHLQRWKSKITKWGTHEEEEEDEKNNGEQPRLVFRRNARATLEDEQAAFALFSAENDMALSLLYEEARQNYLKGLYPCSETDCQLLAAVIYRILHGHHHVNLQEKVLGLLLPPHRLPVKRQAVAALTAAIEAECVQLKANNLSNHQMRFLRFCWSLNVYGSTFFDALVFMVKPWKGTLSVHVGINDYGVHLVNSDTKSLFKSYALRGLDWTFGIDRPYLEMRCKSTGHMFTLRTPQASHINMLLSKLRDALVRR